MTEAFPLTPEQETYLLSAYMRWTTVPVVVNAGEEVGLGPLKQALEQLVARHDSLRLRMTGKHQSVSAELPHIAFVEAGSIEEGRSAIDAVATTPWDLHREGPTRILVVAVPKVGHLVTLRCNHAVLDGWCVPLLFEELRSISGGYRLPPAPSFASHAAGRSRYGELLSPEQFSYWNRVWSAGEFVKFPAGSDGVDPTLDSSAMVIGTVAREVQTAAVEIAQSLNLTLPALGVAAILMAISSVTGQGELKTRYIWAGRESTKNSQLVGLLARSFMLSYSLSATTTVDGVARDMLRNVVDGTRASKGSYGLYRVSKQLADQGCEAAERYYRRNYGEAGDADEDWYSVVVNIGVDVTRPPGPSRRASDEGTNALPRFKLLEGSQDSLPITSGDGVTRDRELVKRLSIDVVNGDEMQLRLLYDRRARIGTLLSEVVRKALAILEGMARSSSPTMSDVRQGV